MNLKEGAHVIYDTLLFIGMAVIYLMEALLFKLIPRRYRAKSIAGEVALVTGGAGGIGRLIAIKLANLGAHVVIWDIDKQGLLEVAEKIREAGGTCHTYSCDIADKKEVYRTAKATKIEVGSVSLLVNNAGYVCGKTLVELPDHEIERTFSVNILSHYWITKSFLRNMMKNNHGHIVTIASAAGLVGNYNCTDYSATKFAAVGYHESLFAELKVHGYDNIRMTLVCPYLINTGMFDGVKSRLLPTLEPEYVAEEVVAGVLTNEMLIVLPNIMMYFLLFKWLVPPKMCWAIIYHVFKEPQAMMMFKGRESRKMNIADNSTTNNKDICTQ
ncbi:short-chain dehydrogenase/reductase family 16C member 6 [Harpegnathos saltator]|uniref:Short-chain dehydrogenase/reductase 3 n=1 Tax=Harpegnathos saltator TaxID=610380 RepID=E2BNA4_HARSA|nr:short-chain dehydrogenase/reductase family 16C member 6 [Harpegnathos saltator]XP_011142042.1 short-chain dehydrogenase/reductase family 16C member 6 [Harpegnathos saltator]EFN82866.1 Epidermal retinal dehydrogenase 2 [Harpegnathos saltator]